MRNRIAHVLWLVVGMCGLVSPRLANATNLVSNPSFESYSALPFCQDNQQNNYRAALAIGWTGTADGSSDYFNTAANITGCAGYTANPCTGNGHTGFAYGGGNGHEQYREFVQQTLPSALVAGQPYRVELYVRREDGSTAADLGVLFTTNAPSNVKTLTPQVVFSVTSTSGCKHLTGYFTPPASGFRTISIGAYNTADVGALNYFFLDDVSITSCAEFAPIVTQQATSQVLTYGQDVIFSIQTSGALTGYQWQRLDPTPVDLDDGDGSEYTGTGTSTLTIVGADYCDVGIYKCNLSYECGIVASQIVALDCVDLPTITSQPVDVTVNVGDPAMFHVGLFPLIPACLGYTYSWSNDTKQISLIDNPPTVTGTMSSTLHFNPTVAGQAGLYTCYVTNLCGTTVSHQVRLTFNPRTGPGNRKVIFTVSGRDQLPKIDRVMLMQNSPNPFNPETQIHFGVPHDMDVTLSIYDSAGRLVRRLVDGQQHGGVWQSVTWDGRSDFGASLASGVYFYRLKAGGELMTKKMVLLK